LLRQKGVEEDWIRVSFIRVVQGIWHDDFAC
jgi:hypothetical protein